MNLFPLSPRLLEALLNGGAQGLLVTVLVAVTLRCLPRINAATRHAVWFACLLLVAALPVLHLILEPAKEPEEAATVAVTTVVRPPERTDLPAPGLEAAAVGDAFGPPGPIPAEEAIPQVSFGTLERQTFAIPSFQARTAGGVGTDDDDQRMGASREAVFPGLTPEIRPALAGPDGDEAAKSLPRWRLTWPRWLADGLVVAWAAVSAFRFGRLGWECVRLGSLKRGAAAAGEETQALFARVGFKMGVKRTASLRVGPEDGVPLVAGFWRPVVVLPAGFLEANSKAQVAQVLSHELAHIHRRDDWSNLVEQGIRAVMFFNPAVWWIAEQLSLDREIACDDHVLEATHQARTYALLLTDFAGRRQSRDLIAAPAVWKKKTQLKERIAMILDSKRNSSPRMAGTMAGLLLLVIAGFTGIVLHAAPRVVLADGETSSIDASTRVVARTVETASDAQVVADNSDQELSVVTTVTASPDVFVEVAENEFATAPRLKPASPADPSKPPTPPSPVRAPAALPVAPAAPPRPGVAYTPRSITIARSSGDDDGDRRGEAVVTVRRGKKDGASLEERLDRLERMMEKLTANVGPGAWAPQGAGDIKFNFNRDLNTKLAEESRKLSLWAHPGADEAGLAEVREKAERSAEKAVRDAERATARIQRDQERVAAKVSAESSNRQGREQLEAQRKALESARRSLEKQLETVEQRLERLEDQQEHLDEQNEKAPKKEPKEKVKEKAPPEPEPQPAPPEGSAPVKN